MKHFTASILLAGAAIAVSSWFPATTQSSDQTAHTANISSRVVATVETEFFSIGVYPALFTETVAASDESTVIIFREHDQPADFQVAVGPATAPLPTTIEEFRTAVPGVEVSEFQISTVGGEPAISFYSFDPGVGDTFEIWFVRDARLYQVLTTAEVSGWVSAMFETLRFK